jgi:small-conductance mechanosensitive channel
VVVVVFWLLARGVRSLIHRVTPGPRDSNIGIVLGRLTFAVIVIGGVFVAAAIIFPGVTAGTLISGLGIGSIAVGFAVQDEVGIGYGDDIERAKGIVMETLNGIEGVLRDPPPDVLTWTLGESTVNLRVR